MSRRSIPLVVAVFAAAITFPLAALASHQFTDVPDSNPYHNDIDALADSGVTTGCGGGNFCPSGLVTREQMAAFLNRLGALGPGKTPVVNAAQLDGVTADQFIRSDGPPETGRFVCVPATMQPIESTSQYTVNGNGLQRASGGEYFGCDVRLPDGAAVTSFAAAFYDASTPSEQATCALETNPVLVKADTLTQMAFVFSGEVFSGGNLVATDTTISNATIDNFANAYWAFCRIQGSGSDILLLSMTIEYTFSGLPVV